MVIEKDYPITFRQEDATRLGEHLRNRHSVDLIGIKRVGISNFLRFFMNNEEIAKTYIHVNEKDIFISVDMNDLVEIDANQFWILTFKRIIDTLENYSIKADIKKRLNDAFIKALKMKELFLTIDAIRSALNTLINEDYLPTIFFLRFDRLKPIINQDFFSNLQGLKEGTNNKIAYVFTSFKGLNEISPEVFDKKSLSVFCQSQYIKPAKESDMEIVFDTFAQRYNIVPHKELKKNIIAYSGGHVQYLHLSLILLNEHSKNNQIDLKKSFDILNNDERISTLSEEIWESLDTDSKKISHYILDKKKIEPDMEKKSQYLFDVGFFRDKDDLVMIFSPFFSSYLEHVLHTEATKDKNVEFTKKENALFILLLDNLDKIVERDKIIETVWPEAAELGVSDWTIDRLISRLRIKLINQKNKYSVVTIKTRGFKMIAEG